MVVSSAASVVYTSQAGGRVLSVVGTGPDLAAARAEAYRILDGVELGGGHFRRDIGLAAEEGHISIPG